MSRAVETVGRVRQRSSLPDLPFNVRAGLASTAVAAAGVVLTLAAGRLPTVQFSIILFTIAPLCAVVAVPVLAGRARAEADDALSWVAAGLAGSALALLLQLISLPAVDPGGGPLRTGGEGSALLYLSAHVLLYGGCLAGTAGVPRRWLRPALAVGVVLVVLQAVNLFPTVNLLDDQEAYTRALIGTEWFLTAVALGTVVAWTRACGHRPPPLRGWVSISLLLSTYELVFNAVGGQRYGQLWWSSLTMRAVGYAALAAGSLGYLLRQSRRVEQFTAAELALRDSELEGSVALTERLLVHARELARSYTPEQVAQTLCTTVRTLTGAVRVSVAHRDPGTQELIRVTTVGDGGPDAADPVPGVSVPRYLVDRREIDAVLAPGERPARDIAAMAVLPLVVGDLVIGSLMLVEQRPRSWSRTERDLLEGLVDQAAPVLSRARLAVREHRTAETLQRSLLPGRLPTVPGLVMTARYQPAGREEQVGGDWYDGWELPDGRLALVIGDVVGKGLTAAATTGRLRASLRALAWADPSPGRVLTQLDRIEAEDTADMVGTVLYALFDANLDGVRIARAGHPPAVLVGPGDRPRLVEGEPGTPIGLAIQPMPECRVELTPGSTLLLYTDGLVEDRARSLDDRLAELLDAVGSHHHPGAPDRLATALMTDFRTRHEDDVALLVASRSPDPAT